MPDLIEAVREDHVSLGELVDRVVERLRELTRTWAEQVLPNLSENLTADAREELGDAYQRAKDDARALR